MEKKMKNGEVERYWMVLGRLGESKDPVACYEIAERINLVQAQAEKIMAARRPMVRIDEYNLRQQDAYDEFADLQAELPAADGTTSRAYSVTDDDGLEKALEALKLEYADDIKAEERRKLGLSSILETEVKVQVEVIDYAWTKGLINAKELAFLLRFGLIKKDTLPGRVKMEEKPVQAEA